MYGSRVRWLAREGQEGRVTREGHVIHCGGVVPAWWLAIAPTMKIPRTPRGAGEPRGWPDSREGGLGPRQGRDTLNGNAPWVRQGRPGPARPARAGPISTSMGVSPCMAAEWNDWLGRAERPGRAETPERPGRAETPETPERAESFTVRGCRAASPGWFWWPVKVVEAVPLDTSPILSDP